MARPLFEQYKEALRRGHLALLSDEPSAAVEAYREAASLVPDRPLPYASLGAVLAQLGRVDEAVEAYDRALTLGPDDTVVIDARAALVARRAAPPEAPEAPASPPSIGRATGHQPPTVEWPAVDLPSAPPLPIEGPPPDPLALQEEADALVDGGDPGAARELLLAAVAVHRDAGRPDAALDACLQLLAIAPGDPRVHLAIANLQLDRGWNEVATQKIELLLRLTALSGDAQAEADVHLLAAERLRDVSPARLDALRKGLPTT